MSSEIVTKDPVEVSKEINDKEEEGVESSQDDADSSSEEEIIEESEQTSDIDQSSEDESEVVAKPVEPKRRARSNKKNRKQLAPHMYNHDMRMSRQPNKQYFHSIVKERDGLRVGKSAEPIIQTKAEQDLSSALLRGNMMARYNKRHTVTASDIRMANFIANFDKYDPTKFAPKRSY